MNLFNLGRQSCLRCSDLQKELDNLRKVEEKYEEDIRNLQEANDKAEKENEEMVEKRKKTNKETSEAIRKLMAEKRKLVEDNKNLLSIVEDITEKYDNVKAENDQLAEKARNDSTEIERLNKRANELHSLNESLQEQIIKSRTFVSSEYRLYKLFLRHCLMRSTRCLVFYFVLSTASKSCTFLYLIVQNAFKVKGTKL